MMRCEAMAIVCRPDEQKRLTVAPALYIAGSDSHHFVDLADSIYRFSPVRAKPEDLARLHGTNERIAVANLGELVRFYHQLLRNLNAPAP